MIYITENDKLFHYNTKGMRDKSSLLSETAKAIPARLIQWDRKAEEKDIPRILELLGQVLQIHADIRPDIFIPGTTKYTTDELTELLKNEEKPVYVAADEADVCVGYAFCQLKEQPFSNNMVPFKSLFIDDLCVDQEARGQHIGESLFEYVKNEAKQLGCYEVTLNVWAGNISAEKFYEKMGMRTKERQMEYIL